MLARESVIDEVRQWSNVSVLVVGAGVNGIGVFRDLALQGVDVLLVDKADFCGGCSAAMTRIIHGGLRYLENGEFRLVRESLKERARLLRNAPHYVKPLGITIPIHDWTSGLYHAATTFLGIQNKPGKRGAAIIKVGLSLYDTFAGEDRIMPRHQFYSRKASLDLRSELDPGIVATASFYDARMPYPERTCLELVQDAENNFPNARALNYVSLAGADGTEVTLRDELTGETFGVRPQIVVNAAGPWIDIANQSMNLDTEYIGGTKGSHLVLDHPQLHEQTQGHMLYFVNKDNRVCIFYPFFDRVIAGATDIPHNDPDNVYCDDEETDYILESIRAVFPNIEVDHSHIVFKFSGVRPLPNQNSATTGQISRDHSCEVIPPGDTVDFPVYSLVGGKWTTYRAFAEQVTDRILDQLGQQRAASTTELPIGGGKDYPTTDEARAEWLNRIHMSTELPVQHLDLLLDRYGTQAEKIASFMCDGDDQPLQAHPDYTQREIIYIVSEERTVRLEDLILRRTLIGMRGELTSALLDELAEITGKVLGWSDERTNAEIAQIKDRFATRHGVTL